MNYIAKFNPYSMDDHTILSLATGRKGILENVLETLRDNLSSDSISQHLLIRGPRGMGKSFFLKYLQINFKKEDVFDQSEFILLPEEQSNINTPAELIKLILNIAKNEASQNVAPMWSEVDDLWSSELAGLKKYIADKKKAHPNYMMVVVLENLDTFLKNIESDKKKRKVHLSSFRYLLENLEGFTLVGAVPHIDSDIDSDYNSRLFHAFKKCTLRPWVEEDYLKYFNRRRVVIEEELDRKYNDQELDLIKAKLKAISLYTGGSPRIAVVLTNLLLEDDVVSTAKTLNGLIDDLTPYYQDLTKSLPKNSKILFDALIRHGENLSQSELAKAVGATQSQISKAFLWLKENGYVYGKKRTNSPAYTYAVADRIHALYHIQREIHHNKSFSSIWLLCDFLVSFYKPEEIRDHALRQLRELPNQSSQDLARVYMLSSEMMSKEQLLDFQPQDGWQKLIEENDSLKNFIRQIDEITNDNSVVNLDKHIDSVLKILNKIENNDLLFAYIGRLCVQSIKFNKNKLFNCAQLLCAQILSFIDEKQFEKYKKEFIYVSAISQQELKNYSKSNELFSESLRLHQNTGNTVKVAFHHYNISKNFTKLELLHEANESLLKANTIFQELSDLESSGMILQLIGFNYYKLNKHIKAVDSHNEALILFGQCKNSSLMAKSLQFIGDNYTCLKKYELALEAYKKSLVLFEQLEDLNSLALTLRQVGESLSSLENIKEAIKFYERSSDLYKNIGEVGLQAENLFSLSISYFQINDVEKGIYFAKKAIDVLSQDVELGLKNYLVTQYSKQLALDYNVEQLNSMDGIYVLIDLVLFGVGQAVKIIEREYGLGKGFEVGNKTINLLSQRSSEIDVKYALVVFLCSLFQFKVSNGLILDLCNEAIMLFPAQENQIILETTKLTVEYMESGRSETFLERVNPDTATAIVEIASIVNLEPKK